MVNEDQTAEAQCNECGQDFDHDEAFELQECPFCSGNEVEYK